jgi:hypothetical protein
MRLRRSAALAVWLAAGILTAPVAILAHELGHLLAAYLLGAEDLELHHSHFSGRSEDGSLSDIGIGLIALAGPISSVLLALVWLWASRGALTRWGLAVVVHATMHFFAAGFAGLLALLVWLQVRSIPLGGGYAFNMPQGASIDSDAGMAASKLHLPYPLVVGAGLVFAIFLAHLALRNARRRAGWAAAVILVVGVLVGQVAWTAVVGPMILP